MAESTKPYEYFAFISYKREDEKWAKWLQHKLEYYKLPSSVRKDNPELPDKIRPVFKDTTDLEPGVLAQKIQNALDSSKFLIVICSPRSANSIWVSKEVQSFIDSGRADHIIPFIIGGTPNATAPKDECFPEGLRQLAGEQELLGANINEMGREAAAIKVVARMFNLRFDTLWQRYERVKRRRQLMMGVFSIVILAMFIYMTILYFDRNSAYQSLSESNKRLEQANRDLEQSRDSILAGNNKLAVANDSIRNGYRLLEITNNNLEIRTNELAKSNYNLQKERIRLVAEAATKLFKSGEVLKAYNKIKPFLMTTRNSIPFEPTVEALFNEIALYLSSEEYKKVDVIPLTSEDSSYDIHYFSPDKYWNAYGSEGRYYLYNFKSQRTLQLPGSWWNTCDFSFKRSGEELFYASYGDAHLWNLNLGKEVIIEGLPQDFNDDWIEFLKEYLTKHDFPPMQIFDDDTWLESENAYVETAIEPDALKNTVFYESVVSQRDMVTATEFITNRSIRYFIPEASIHDGMNFIHTKNVLSLRYKDKTWWLLDTLGQYKLYSLSKNLENEGNLLFYNGTKLIEFTPYLGWSLGNGQSLLTNAFIIDSDNILCLADQGPHIVYTISNQSRRYFDKNNLDLWEFGHPGVFVVASKMLDKDTLVDVRGGGVITYYDIPTGLILAEYSVPNEFIREIEGVSMAIIKNDREIILIGSDDRTKCIKVKIPSIEQRNEFLIRELDSFWN